MQKALFFLITFSGFFSCSPKVLVSATKQAITVKDYEGFIIFKENEKFDIPADEVGNIEIKDGGFAINCDYETVIDIAKKEAQKMGANCLKIYEHRLPSVFGSSCHRIKAKAYRLNDISPFEKQIIWNAKRKLKRENFKGSIENRPFEAATNSGIIYRYYIQPLKGKIVIKAETYFDCQNSYFKGTLYAMETLEHEQGHFDLTEIYARKLRKELKNKIHSQKDFEQKHENIYREILNQLQIVQDKYDSEIYPNRSLQKQWTTKIQQDLESLNEFEQPEILISTKA